MAMNWMITTCFPTWFERIGFTECASNMRELTDVSDKMEEVHALVSQVTHSDSFREMRPMYTDYDEHGRYLVTESWFSVMGGFGSSGSNIMIHGTCNRVARVISRSIIFSELKPRPSSRTPNDIYRANETKLDELIKPTTNKLIDSSIELLFKMAKLDKSREA